MRPRWGGHGGFECGDLSPLLRRRLVAVELLCAADHADTLALARAVDAPCECSRVSMSDGDKSPWENH